MNSDQRDSSKATKFQDVQTVQHDNGDGTYTIVTLNSATKRIKLELVNASNARDNTKGSLEIAIADMYNKRLTVREWKVCDDAGAEKFALFVSSEMYDASVMP